MENKRVIIAVSGERQLEQIDELNGRVIIPPTGYEGPVHSIASIAARGYWEPVIEQSESTKNDKAERPLVLDGPGSSQDPDWDPSKEVEKLRKKNKEKELQKKIESIRKVTKKE